MLAALLLLAHPPALAQELPAVTLRADPAQVVEGETFRFRVAVSPAVKPVTVRLRGRIDGGYVVGYPPGVSADAPVESLTFSASDMTQTRSLTYATIDDEIEGAGGSMSLRVQASADYTSRRLDATAWITDNDKSLVTVRALDVPEGDGVPVFYEGGTARFELTRSRSTGAVPVTVQLGRRSHPYGAQYVVFAGSEMTRTIKVLFPLNDKVEGDRRDSFRVRVFPLGIADLALPQQMGYILRDQARVSIGHGSHAARVTEGQDAIVEVTRGGATGALTVHLAVATEGDFFGTVEPAMAVKFAAQEMSRSLTFATQGDGEDEPDGALTVRVVIPDRLAAPGYRVAATGSVPGPGSGEVRVTVVNDDPVTVSVAAAQATVAEGATAWFTLTRGDTSTELPVAVTWRRTPQTKGQQLSTTFPAGSSTVRFGVPVANDRVLNAGSELVVSVSDPTDGAYRVRTDHGEARVAVLDDEAPRLSLSAVRASVPEGHGCANFLIRYADALGAVSNAHASFDVPVTLSYRGALFPAGAAATMTVTVSRASQTFCVPLAADEVDEEDGSVTASVVAGAGSIFTVAEGAGTATVAVTDDDLPAVSLAVDPAHADGGVEGTAVSFTATREGVLDGELTVPVTVRLGSGAARAASVSFGAGAATAALTATVAQDDGLFRPPRPLTATVRGGSGWRVAGRVQEVTVAVRDDDRAVASVTAARGSVTEDLGCAGFTVSLANAAGLGAGPDAWLDVPLALTQTGAFLAGTDPVTVRMRSLSRAVCVELDDDEVAEANGTVTATVSPADADVNLRAAAGSGAAATVTVVDDDTAGTPATGPAVTAVSLISTPGASGAYAIGDRIDVAVTFAAAVVVNGVPHVALRVGTALRPAAYRTGSGTRTLTFSYVVAEGDGDADGIAVATDALRANGGRIGSDRGAAALALPSELSWPAHRVDGIPPQVTLRISPRFERPFL